MKNVDRLARHIAQYGGQNTIIHTIPGTSNWIICQKIEEDKWALKLCNPMGNVVYNLGLVTDDQHLALWAQITNLEIENRTSQIKLARDLKSKINNFKKAYEKNYQNLLKNKAKKVKKEAKSKSCNQPKTIKSTIS